MATVGQWVQGARPRTLPAALAPVLVGTGAAAAVSSVVWLRAALALLVAVALQVGVNYANDYSDGIRGTDERRVGPVRLVGQGLADAAAVKAAAFGCFAVAAVAGLVLVALIGQWWLLLVGAASILAAWFYTGGSRPYGYAGLGEVFVFVFFGPVPVVGTAYVQTLDLADPLAWLASVGVGALICAILVANNLRDIPTDAQSGKHTLAVRLGDARTRGFYVVLVAVALLVVVALAVAAGSPWPLLGLLAAPLALGPVRALRSGAVGPALVPVLKATGVLVLGYGVLVAAGLALTSR